MNFRIAIIKCFMLYAIFSGRAKRAEFWWFFLFCILLYMLAFSLSINEIWEPDSSNPEKFLSQALTSWFGIAVILTLIPSISVSVRRFHDINMSGWWYVALQVAPSILAQFLFIFSFISFMALFAYLYFMCAEGGEENQYGSNPLKNKEPL